MIITRLLGGLGNQMFQYAAGLALAHARRTVLKLDVSWFREYADHEAHNAYGLSCFNITEQFATQEEIDRVRGVPLTRAERWSAQMARWLHFYRYADALTARGNRHAPPTFRFYPEFFDQPDDTYLEGMWQSEKYFADIAGTLRLHFSFRFPPTPAVRAMSERIRSGPSAAVHFRRGDYVRNAAFSSEMGVLSARYYERAVALLCERCPDVTLYVFSDDIDAVERHFKPEVPHVFVGVTEPWHAYDNIRLIGECQHAIISNSTFAWWGAWLNPAPKRMVIAPAPWFNNSSRDGGDIVPADWISLPAARVTAE